MCKKVLRLRDIKNSNYGEIGTPTTFDNYKIGDVVFWKNGNTQNCSIIVDMSNGKGIIYGIMGWGDTKFSEFNLVYRVVKAENLTNEILNSVEYLNQKHFYIDEIIPKKLTQKEIEELLGYPISIVE